jgi:transposase
MSAILWRRQNGAKLGAMPEEFGPWWMVAWTFVRRPQLGVWERLLAMTQGRARRNQQCACVSPNRIH